MTPEPLCDPERTLSLAYAPADRRAGLEALWRLDERLTGVAGEPNGQIAAIKLAWWREALERLDSAPPPAEPLLLALAAHVLPAGVRGVRLSELAESWEILFDVEQGDAAGLTHHARIRGTVLFAIAADLLGGHGEDDVLADGMIWAAATIPSDLDPATAGILLNGLPRRRKRLRRRLRALGVLGVLGRMRLQGRQGARPHVGTALRALWHGISGY